MLSLRFEGSMRIFSMALVAGVALAIGVVGLKLNSQASAAVDARQVAGVERFVMQASGDEQTCVVQKTGAGPLSKVSVAPQCDAMMPGLSGLHYWSENADGTVALSADGHTPAVIFAQADGVAYESIEPRTPLIALISKD